MFLLVGIVYSSDYGVSWASADVNNSIEWFGLGVDRSGQNWIACGQGIIAQSTNFGVNWVHVYSSYQSNFYSCSSDSSGQYLVAADNIHQQIVLSTNYGLNWSVTATITNASVLSSDPTGQAVTIAGFSGFIYQSIDYGRSFYVIHENKQLWSVLWTTYMSKYLIFGFVLSHFLFFL